MVLCLSLFVLVGCGGNKTNTPVRRPDTSAGTSNTAPSDATPAPQTAAPAQEQPVTVTFYDGDVLYATAAADADGVTLPTAPTKEGYVFDGWFTDRDTLRIAFTPSVRITADSTVYAKWHAVEENSGENSGENGGSTENQGENGNSGENQGENQGENNGENGENNGNENPEDPNQEDPNQGGQENPQPEQLDFSGLEAKLVEVIREKHWGITSENIIVYGLDEGTLNVVYEVKSDVGAGIALGKIENIGELEDQEDINSAVNSRITKKSFKTQSLIGKTSSDITVDDQTYSKDGIEGDNPFARQCGVENAWMTYLSDMGLETFADFVSGYGRIFNMLILNIGEGENICANKYNIIVESEHEDTEVEIFKRFINGGCYAVRSEEQFMLGKDLKNSQIAEASDWEMELFN